MSRLITRLEHWPSELRGCGVAIGNFDAVHLGHAALAGQLVALTESLSLPAVVFTFDPPPGVILFPERPRTKPLTNMSRRAQLFGKLGVAALLAYPTSSDFLRLTAREFFEQIIVDKLAARVMVEGPNFRFGLDRQGDVPTLARWCAEAGIQFSEVTLLQSGDDIVSSTRVRDLVTRGQLRQANQMLLEPYRIEGRVVAGAQRGRTIGFPTANLAEIDVLLPAMGVYAGRVLGLSDQPMAAAVHLGPNPTFSEDQAKVEVHVPGWQGSLYDRRLTVELLQEVRGIVKFPSVEALKSQLTLDVEQCRQIAAQAATRNG